MSSESEIPQTFTFDCVVVGSGNAGSCAALAAKDSGCNRVLLIDKCPPEWVGGNGYFTAGAYRTTHEGLHDLLPIVRNVPADSDLASKIDLDPYTHDDFTGDIMRLGQDRPNPELVKALVDNSRDAIQWLSERVKIPFTFAFNRQAYLVDGRQKFWGGLALSVQDGGKGVIAAHQKALEDAGVEVWFNTPAVQLNSEAGAITGLVVNKDGQPISLCTPAVILAAGGYEASRQLRGKYMGTQWEFAKVRSLFVSLAGINLTFVGSRFVVHHTTPGTDSPWPPPSAQSSQATSRDVIPLVGMPTHLQTLEIVFSVTNSQNRVTHSVLC